MNKTISKSLSAVNIVFVLLLLSASVVMIFIANTKQNNIFSYQAKLVVGEKLDNKIGDKCLVFVKLDKPSKLNKGSYLLYAVEGISHIVKVNKVDSNIVSYTSKSGETLSLNISTENYYGRVTFSSNVIGSILYAFTSKDSVSLTFILIGGIFIISMLSLTIIYAIHAKKKSLANNSELQYQEKMELFDDDEDEEAIDLDYVFQEDNLIATYIADNDNESFIDTTFGENDIEFKVDDALLVETIKQTSRPPYYLLDNDIPSVDSLMESIDAQFHGFTEQDDDIKIFASKN